MKPRLYGTFGSLLIVIMGIAINGRPFAEVVDVQIDQSPSYLGTLSNGVLSGLTAACFISCVRS
jgi:hypothetical protein